MSFPWTLTLSTALGVWTMFAPRLFGLEGLASDAAHLGGALIIVVSVVAMGEPLRAVRFLNVLLALVLAVSPWLADEVTMAGRMNGLVVGLVVAGLAFPRGPKTETYGSWDRLVF